MRLISQDGFIDIPYEQVGLSTGYMGDKSEYYVFANSLYMNRKPQVMGIYSSEEKALKVMEMVRKEYEKPVNHFQFPKDVEV